MREGVTMAKMYQVDKMATVATMAIMAFSTCSTLESGSKVNQIESIKMGMSSEIVLKKCPASNQVESAANTPRFKCVCENLKSYTYRGRCAARGK